MGTCPFCVEVPKESSRHSEIVKGKQQVQLRKNRRGDRSGEAIGVKRSASFSQR